MRRFCALRAQEDDNGAYSARARNLPETPPTDTEDGSTGAARVHRPQTLTPKRCEQPPVEFVYTVYSLHPGQSLVAARFDAAERI